MLYFKLHKIFAVKNVAKLRYDLLVEHMSVRNECHLNTMS